MSSNKTRAIRRHHRERLIHKFFKQNMDTHFYVQDDRAAHEKWAMKNASVRTTCRSVKDCDCCCHPRKLHGNSKAALTMQEQRLALRVNDTEEE